MHVFCLSYGYEYLHSPQHTHQVEGRLAGDSLELSALKGSSWRYDGNRSLAIPPPAAALEEGEGALRIVVRHPFSASLQRMSVVVARNATHGDGGAPHTHMALVKGSPEAMKVTGTRL